MVVVVVGVRSSKKWFVVDWHSTTGESVTF